MKKIVITIAAMLAGVSAMAQEWDSIILKSGSFDWALSRQNISQVIDFDNAVEVEFTKELELDLVKDGKFYDYHTREDVENSVKMYLKSCELQTKFGGFKKKVGAGFPYSKPNAVYKYELKVVVDTIDTGNTGAAAVLAGMNSKTGGMTICGNATVTDLETGEVVCEMDLERAQGYGYGVRGFKDKLFNLIYRYLFLETACGYDVLFHKIKK
ncbi:MAG: hypothetical protein MJY56_02630 [Bacteroidales bacterium]|nr:hypothetical protein [Bacteroidales bacterium]